MKKIPSGLSKALVYSAFSSLLLCGCAEGRVHEIEEQEAVEQIEFSENDSVVSEQPIANQKNDDREKAAKVRNKRAATDTSSRSIETRY